MPSEAPSNTPDPSVAGLHAVYLTDIQINFLQSNNTSIIGEFDTLAYQIYAHFFTGPDGAHVSGSFSGTFITTH